jgi:lysozyme family protein
MKHNFDQCMEWLLEHEGGFVNHPDDPGGMTNYGVTAKTYQRWLSETRDLADEVDDPWPKDITEAFIKGIPMDHVYQIYKQEYWNRVNADSLPSGIDWCVFDWAVNSGSGRSSRALQKAVEVTADGAIGPMTIRAVKSYDQEDLIEHFYQRRQQFYEGLKTFDTFGRGWSRRNKETRNQAIELLDQEAGS